MPINGSGTEALGSIADKAMGSLVSRRVRGGLGGQQCLP